MLIEKIKQLLESEVLSGIKQFVRGSIERLKSDLEKNSGDALSPEELDPKEEASKKEIIETHSLEKIEELIRKDVLDPREVEHLRSFSYFDHFNPEYASRDGNNLTILVELNNAAIGEVMAGCNFCYKIIKINMISGGFAGLSGSWRIPENEQKKQDEISVEEWFTS